MKRHKSKTKIKRETVGNVGVSIYERTRRTKDGKRTVFEIADYSTGVRRLRGFSDPAEARKEAKRIAGLLACGEVTAAQMRGPDAASYGRAIELLRPSGIPLELVAAHFAEERARVSARLLPSPQFIFVQ